MALNKEMILKAEDRKTKEVDVPEWGGTVFVRMMSGNERDSFDQQVEGKYSASGVRAKLLVRCLVDETGNRLFTDDEFDSLGEKSAKVISRLSDEALELNRVTKGDVDELAKN